MAAKNQNGATDQDVLTMPLTELEQRVTKALDLLTQIETLLPGLIELDPTARKHSIGRLRDGEGEALLGVLDATDKFPGYFQALAARDNGKDNTVFEAAPTREALRRRELLGKVSAPLDRLDRKLSDSRLYLGAKGREVGLAAYAIGRVNAQSDEKLRSALASSIAFFMKPPAKRTRKAKKEE